MLKAKEYAWSDTNVSLFGSVQDKKAREEASEAEPAWENAGTAEGLQKWRVEQFKMKKVMPGDMKSFFRGDSYIVLHTYKVEEALNWDLYFWIGRESSQDEYGTAAYKTVELDDHLGGAPVQHREVDGHESDGFRKLFDGMLVLNGGIDSGFNHVQPESYQPRLLHFKGKGKSVLCYEVPKKTSSLNSGDAFILDLGKKLYCWYGANCNKDEKFKATQMAQGIDDDRGSGVDRIVISQGDDDDVEEFWSSLEGAKEEVAEAETSEDYEAGEKKLFRLHDQDFSQVASGDDVTLDKFVGDDAFLFDAGNTAFAWVGANCSAEERKFILVKSADYFVKSGRPAVPITRVLEGGALGEFNSFFA